MKNWLAGPDDADPRFTYLHSAFFAATIPAAAVIERLTADRRPGEERELDFIPWGGAYNRVPAGATAFPHRDAVFLLKQSAVVAPGEEPGEWFPESYRMIGILGTGGAYPNFPEPGRDARHYHLGNTDRLRRVLLAYEVLSRTLSNP